MGGTLSVSSKTLETENMTIVDVRDITEFEESHISGAKHAYVGFLPELKNIDSKLDPQKPLVVMCSVGHRASLAMSILLRSGFKNVFNLLGGITAWRKLDKPLVSGPDEKQTLDLEIIKKHISKESSAKAVQSGV
jgi:hydroxyacylglutathione hydrolase